MLINSHRERLNEETPVVMTGDAIVRPALNRENAEAGRNDQSVSEYRDGNSARISLPHFTSTESISIGTPQFGVASELNRNARISSDGLEPCDGNKAEAGRKLTGHRERLSEETSYMDDAIVCSHRNKNYEKSAEMTDSSQSIEKVTIQRESSLSICCAKIWRRGSEGGILCTLLIAGSLPLKGGSEKFPLIDSNAEIADEAEGESHRERLSEETSYMDDATVRSHGNNNHERLAEMTGPVERRVTRKHLYTVR